MDEEKTEVEKLLLKILTDPNVMPDIEDYKNFLLEVEDVIDRYRGSIFLGNE